MIRLFLVLLLATVTYPYQVTVSGENRLPDWSVGGKIAYIRTIYTDSVGTETNGLWVVDEYATMHRRIVRGELLGAPVWSTAGTHIAFAANIGGEDGIYVVGENGSGLNNLTAPTGGGSHPAWSPDGSRLAFSRDGDIWVIDADGANETQLTDTAVPVGDPLWSPGGESIAYLRVSRVEQLSPGYAIWLMKPDGNEQKPLTAYVVRGGYDWSPDGTRDCV